MCSLPVLGSSVELLIDSLIANVICDVRNILLVLLLRDPERTEFTIRRKISSI